MTNIRITAAGHTFIAALHPDAPLTAAAFMKLLPYRQKLIHVRWSGEGVWVPLGEFQLGVGFENHTSHPSVGDILFYPGGYSETEIILAYGACSFASKMGQLAGNHFMTIVRAARTCAPSALQCCGKARKTCFLKPSDTILKVSFVGTRCQMTYLILMLIGQAMC